MAKQDTVPNNSDHAEMQELIEAIRKIHGDDAVFVGDAVPDADVDVIPSGSLNLDRAIGVGGIPRGRSIEVFGPESSGKSTLVISIMAQAQKMGLMAGYIDTEHALAPEWAETIGLDLSQLIISQPESAEQALNVCRSMVKSNRFGVVTLDSVAAMATEAELENNIGDATVAVQARIMSDALKKLCHDVFASRTALIFVNQIRDNINATRYAPRETTSGGRALKFYSSVRIELRRIESVKQGEKFVGNRVRARVIKNKVAAPFKSGEFEIMFDRGIDQAGEYIDHALRLGSITRRGSHFYLDDKSIGNGREMVRRNLLEDEELMEKIREQVNTGLADEN